MSRWRLPEDNTSDYEYVKNYYNTFHHLNNKTKLVKIFESEKEYYRANIQHNGEYALIAYKMKDGRYNVENILTANSSVACTMDKKELDELLFIARL